MAIVATNRINTNSGTNASTYTFAAPSAPGANDLVILYVAASSSITRGQPTVSGTMSTWTLLSRISEWAATNNQFDCFWAMQASPAPSVMTFAFPGTQADCHVIMDSFSGVSTEAPFQSAQSIVLSASNLAILLSAPAAGSAVAGGASRLLNSAQTASSDFVLLASNNQNSPAQNLASSWTVTNSSRVTMFAASAGSMAGVALEMRPAPAGAAVFAHYYHGYYRPMVIA